MSGEDDTTKDFDLTGTIPIPVKEIFFSPQGARELLGINILEGMRTYDDVEKFHHAFGHPVRDAPTVPSARELKLRARLIREEMQETLNALEALEQMRDQLPDHAIAELMTEITDGICDSIYVLQGCGHALGLPTPEAWEMVHEANMSKLGPNGEPIYDEAGKVQKPDGWESPDDKIRALIEDLGVVKEEA